MKESDFQAELLKSLRTQGCYAEKIPDAPTSKMKGLRFTLPKPFDIFASVNGQFVAIECKQIKKFEAFGLSHMRPSQIEHLSKVIQKGGRAFVFLNVRIKPSVAKQIKHENRLLIFDWGVWHERWKIESLKKKDIEERPFIQGFDHYYDLNEWKILI